MSPLEYLLIASFALLLTASGALAQAVRASGEGYQDEQGFHFGPTPVLALIVPAPSSSDTPDSPKRADTQTEAKPQIRQILGSKPPMLPADLQAEDLKKQTGHATEAPTGSENA